MPFVWWWAQVEYMKVWPQFRRELGGQEATLDRLLSAASISDDVDCVKAIGAEGAAIEKIIDLVDKTTVCACLCRPAIILPASPPSI